VFSRNHRVDEHILDGWAHRVQDGDQTARAGGTLQPNDWNLFYFPVQGPPSFLKIGCSRGHTFLPKGGPSIPVSESRLKGETSSRNLLNLPLLIKSLDDWQKTLGWKEKSDLATLLSPSPKAAPQSVLPAKQALPKQSIRE
jgi:hypothetical protein